MLLFPNSLCIKESHHINLNCSRDAKVLYILCITTKCMKSQQNYLFKKKGTKKRQVYALKEDLRKRTLAQNINIFVLI